MQAMQRRIETRFDPEIEALGFDKMRSSIEITLKGGGSISGKADERYRGGPENPLSDEEVEAKVYSCAEGVLPKEKTAALIAKAWNVLELDDAAELARMLQA